MPDLPLSAAADLRVYLASAEGAPEDAVPDVRVFDREAFPSATGRLADFASQELRALLESAAWSTVEFDEEGMDAFADVRDALDSARRMSGTERNVRLGEALRDLGRLLPHLPEGSARMGLEALRAWDTPTICNALELVVPERRGHGFTIRPMVAADVTLKPICGLARTGTLRAAAPSGRPAATEARSAR